MSHSLFSFFKPRSRKETMHGLGNRRLTPRKNIPAEVLITPLEVMVDPFWATTENLSDQGLFINSKRFFPVDSSLLLKILPHQQNHPIWIRATIVHVIKGFGFGCRFDQINQDAKSALSQLINRATLMPHVARKRKFTPPFRRRRNTIVRGGRNLLSEDDE